MVLQLSALNSPDGRHNLPWCVVIHLQQDRAEFVPDDAILLIMERAIITGIDLA
jgi:hypothetical protein